MSGLDKQYWPFCMTFTGMLSQFERSGSCIFEAMMHLYRDIMDTDFDTADREEWLEMAAMLEKAMDYMSIALSLTGDVHQMFADVILGKGGDEDGSASEYLH